MPRNVRLNLRAWRNIILPRILVYTGALVLHVLRDRSRDDDTVIVIVDWTE